MKIFDTWSEIKKDSRPLVMYGAGSVAETLVEVCREREIDLVAAFVDEQYYVSNSFVDDIPLMRYEEVHRKYSDFSVIIGFCDYYKGYLLKKNRLVPGEVFYPFNYLFGWSNPKKLWDEHENELNQIREKLGDDFSGKCLAASFEAMITQRPECLFDCYEGEQNYFCNSVFDAKGIETFLDIGAFTGDTLRELETRNDIKVKKIWAVEGDKETYEELCKYLEQSIFSQTAEPINVFLGEKDGEVHFLFEEKKTKLTRRVDTEEGESVQTQTLDRVLRDREVPVDYLKINVSDNGLEEILNGGIELITKDKPVIAVMLCNPFLLLEVAGFFERVEVKYEMYLRFHAAMPERLALYAIPDTN